ncbi:MAG TPA: hypothetical protein VGF08_04070 [Terriglobales bacterium]
MKYKLFIALAIGLLVLGLNSAAVAAPPTAKVNVPFDFIVGNNHLPAGSYFVSALNGHLVALGSSTGYARTIVTRHYGEARQFPALVFNRVGRQYFLAEVWFDWNEGMKVPQGNAEKEALRAVKESTKTVLAMQ